MKIHTDGLASLAMLMMAVNIVTLVVADSPSTASALYAPIAHPGFQLNNKDGAKPVTALGTAPAGGFGATPNQATSYGFVQAVTIAAVVVTTLAIHIV